MKNYQCRVCKEDIGELPLSYLCNKCFEQYRKDKAFREAYHKKFPRDERED